jgi:hypothetical protein
MKYYALFAVALASANANADSGSNIKSLPINMMAQLYGVPESQVSAEILDETRLSARVIARAPLGQRCMFDLVRAPAGSGAPSGWLTAAPDCTTRDAK